MAVQEYFGGFGDLGLVLKKGKGGSCSPYYDRSGGYDLEGG